MDRRRVCGGILRLLEVAEDYPAEIRADFRKHYGISFDDVGKSVTWLEAVALTSVLMRDPESWLAAAMGGWKHPVSREWMVMAELFDLTFKVNSKKAKPLPRPWPSGDSKKIGETKLPRDKVIAILDKMNPKE